MITLTILLLNKPVVLAVRVVMGLAADLFDPKPLRQGQQALVSVQHVGAATAQPSRELQDGVLLSRHGAQGEVFR